MTELYSKLHGTTTDSFRIGLKNQRVVLTGTTTGSSTTDLVDREGSNFTTDSTVFFTAFIVGRGITSTAAYQIKGCYLGGTTTISGYVVDTYVDTSGFTEPTLIFSASGELTLECTGIAADTISWTASIDFVLV